MQHDNYLHTALHEASPEVVGGKGKNIIPPPEREPLWRGYIAKFKDPIIVILLVVFALSVAVAIYEMCTTDKGAILLLEPTGILIALLLATGVGFIFEVKANREFDILNKVKDSRPIKVYRRHGDAPRATISSIPKQDVVVGDIVRLESGDEVPADGIIIEATQLRADESNFTGETYANKYADEALFDNDATYPSNFLLRGSTIIEGNAIMRITAVGVDTEEGRGVARASEGSDVETPLNKQLAQLGKWISIASFVIATLIIVGRVIVFLVANSAEGTDPSLIEVVEFVLGSVMIAVTLIVVAVPEGLPMSITVSLALSMRRMLREKSLVRKLHACETMGATTVICTDKTGTLTKNKMTVVEIFTANDNSRRAIAECMAVNSTAEISYDEGKATTIGNPTEGALLMWLQSQNIDYTTLRDSFKVEAQEPFTTERKYMATTATERTTERRVRFIKGAPEIVLAMSDSIEGGYTADKIAETLAHYQAHAMRTLGFAMASVAEDGSCGEVRFLGVVGIADPVREDVPSEISSCMHSSGVRVIIVTGDVSGTAQEIGRQIGLITSDEEGQVITGPEFATLSDEEACELLRGPKLKVISRARPDDKARLVMLLQRNGEVVAVTGDGTNDAPALSKAQVGLSMGDGTSRAKEASDITIIDNSFASINKAIMWGRSLYLNIRRFIIFQMTINLCACLIVLAGAFTGLESPLTVTQMLWVNLIMDTFAAMALSSLPADRSVLSEKPRRVDSHIISRKMLKRIVATGLLFFVVLMGLWQLFAHADITSARQLTEGQTLGIFFEQMFSASDISANLTRYEDSIFFSIFVMLQFWNIFNAKYFNTERSLIADIVDLVRAPHRVKGSYSKQFILILFVILFGQIVIVNCAGDLFNVTPLAVQDWLWIVALTSPVAIVPDIIRIVKRSKK